MSGSRGTAQGIADLAQRPREPQVTDAGVRDGSWASVMVSHVAPYGADFAAFLGRALPPNAAGPQGPSASDRLVAALRALDETVLVAHRRVPGVAARQELGSVADFNAAARARRDQERARAALSRIGAGR